MSIEVENELKNLDFGDYLHIRASYRAGVSVTELCVIFRLLEGTINAVLCAEVDNENKVYKEK